MTTPLAADCGLTVEGVEADESPGSRQLTRHVTILMAVAGSSNVDGMATSEDGPAAGGEPPQCTPRPSPVVSASIPAAVLELADAPASADDTTVVTDEEGATNAPLPLLAPAIHAPEAVVPADDLPGGDAAAADGDDTAEVDLGWGIVLPELSVQDFKEILSFPKL